MKGGLVFQSCQMHTWPVHFVLLVSLDQMPNQWLRYIHLTIFSKNHLLISVLICFSQIGVCKIDITQKELFERKIGLDDFPLENVFHWNKMPE